MEVELASLKKVNLEFARFQGDRHYVLGNHDVWTLTKEQFLANCGREKEFYSFDRNGFHFVLLDACYRSDGVAYGKQNFRWNDADISAGATRLVEADLQRAGKPTVVFVHQRLDVRNEHGVKSAPAVRKILEESKNVLAVFKGTRTRMTTVKSAEFITAPFARRWKAPASKTMPTPYCLLAPTAV